MRLLVAGLAAAVVLAGVSVAVVATRGGSGGQDCAAYEGNARERCEAAQAKARQERIRRHCAENPYDRICQRAASGDPCKERGAEGEECRAAAQRAERMRAYCRENPDDPRCQR
jgi:hypothetical protein